MSGWLAGMTLSRDRLVRLLATTALTTAVAGVRAGALEAGKQLAAELRRERPGYARVLDRLRRQLADLAREDRLSRAQQRFALEATIELFRLHGLSETELVELDLSADAAAQALLDRGADTVRAAGLDGPTDGLSRRLVRTCYREMLADTELIPRLDVAVNRQLLSRTSTALDRLDDLPQRVAEALPVEGQALTWPVVLGTPPLPAVALQPRQDLQDRLAASGHGAAVLVQLVAGDGGVGKSQLAAAVFRQAAHDGVQIRAWIDASSRASIISSLATLAGRLHLPEAAGQDADAAAAAARDYLTGTDRSWLLVYDDVTDPADVDALWPQGATGRLLVTTRRRDLQPAGAQTFEVGVFRPEESLAYLTEKLTGDQPPPGMLDGAEDLAEELGQLPLALSQAAAVIAFDRITCAQYRSLLGDRTNDLERLFPPEARADEYGRTVSSAWSLAVDRANDLEPKQLAGVLLEVAAVLNPSGIPTELFATDAVMAYASGRLAQIAGTAGTEAPAVDDDAVHRGLGHLRRLSLLALDTDPLRVHALVQRVTRSGMSQDAIDTASYVAADALLIIWPEVERDPARSEILRQNAADVMRSSSEGLIGDEAHALIFRVERSFGEAGQVNAAIAATRQLHQNCLHRLGPDHPDTLSARHNLASWRGEAGDAGGAVAEFERLLADDLRLLGPDHPGTLRTRNNLAYWRGEAGDVAGAVVEFERLLADRMRVLGRDHPDTLMTRNNLGYWRGEAGDATGAVAEFEGLLADRIRVLGPDHPNTLGTRNNLATAQGRTGDATGAVAALERLLVDLLPVLGPDHPNTLRTRNNLAYWRGEAGDAAGAVAAFEQLLSDRLRVLGPDHPDTLATLNNLAFWRGEAGDAAGAAAEFERLLVDQLRLLGPDHPHTLTTRDNLAYLQRRAKDTAG